MQDSVDGFQIKRKNHLLSLTRKKVMRIIAIFLIWALVIVYMCLPISRMKGLNITGNVFLSDSDVIEIAHINSNTFRWDFDENEAKDLLNNYEFGNYSLISKSSINNKIYKVSISINEVFPLGVLNNEVILSSGEKISLEDYENNIPQYYKDSVGYLPELTINNLKNDSFEDFVKYTSDVNDGYIELRKSKEILSIKNSIVNSSPSDEVYTVQFKEIHGAKNITINIDVSSNRFTEKLTLKNYNEIKNSVINRLSTSSETNVIVDVDYIGAWKIIEG